MPKAKLHIEVVFHEPHAPATLRALRPVLYGEIFERLPGCNPALTRLRVGPPGLTATRVALRNSHAPLRKHIEERIREEVLTCVEAAMTTVKRREAEDRERRQRVADGYSFAVAHEIEGLSYGPVYFRTLEEAVELRDKIVRESECAIPDDYFERQARVLKLTVGIDAHERGAWTPVRDAKREVVYGVDFIDGARERIRKR